MKAGAAIYKRDPVSGEEALLGRVAGEAAIGSGPGAGVRVNDLRCSGIHALIQRDPETGGYVILDLGSQSGTFVGGKRVEEAPLKTGEVFQIGSHRLVLREEGGPVSSAPESPEARAPFGLIEEGDRVRKLVTERNLLDVSLYWGEQLLERRTFTEGARITLGNQRNATFGVSLIYSELQLKQPFQVGRYEKGALHLRLPHEAKGLAWIGSDALALDTLRHGEGYDFQGFLDLKLRVGDRAHVEFGELSLLFRFVDPAKIEPLPFWRRLDRDTLRIYAGVAALFCLVLLVFTLVEPDREEKTLEEIPEHLKQVLYDAGIAEAIKRQQAAIGNLAQNIQGGRARAEEGQASAKKAPEKPVEVAKAAPQKAPVKAPAPEAKVDLDSAFTTPNQKELSQNVAMVGQTQAGNTAAALAKGGFARGTKGNGAGGGGSSVGIGQLSGYSTGGGMGAGDYGLEASKGREVEAPVTEEVEIVGGLDPDVIAAIIRRYLPQIRHCYEQQLILKPKLGGKVTVDFTIAPDGAVSLATVIESSLNDRPTEQCMVGKIRTWKFPKPKGGGTVSVKYPFLLMSNTGG